MTTLPLNERVLNQLCKYNLPYTQYKELDDVIIIDIPVRESINGDLYHTCPFCVNKRKKNNTPYQNSKPITHFYPNKYGVYDPPCDHGSIKYWDLPLFKFNLIKYGTAPFIQSKF